jgi:hypothetical protein
MKSNANNNKHIIFTQEERPKIKKEQVKAVKGYNESSTVEEKPQESNAIIEKKQMKRSKSKEEAK